MTINQANKWRTIYAYLNIHSLSKTHIETITSQLPIAYYVAHMTTKHDKDLPL